MPSSPIIYSWEGQFIRFISQRVIGYNMVLVCTCAAFRVHHTFTGSLQPLYAVMVGVCLSFNRRRHGGLRTPGSSTNHGECKLSDRLRNFLVSALMAQLVSVHQSTYASGRDNRVCHLLFNMIRAQLECAHPVILAGMVDDPRLESTRS